MIDCPDLMAKAERLRKRFGEDNNSPIDIFSLAQEINKLTLVFYPMGEKMSGMCIKGDGCMCTIAINSSMTLGRQRFSLAHEFYHLFFDDSMTSFCSKQICSDDENEKKADIFASYFLMPRVALYEKVEDLLEKHDGGLNVRDIISIEQYFQVSHQTALYQLNNCNYINRSELKKLLNTSVRHLAETIGYSSDLYLPSPIDKQYRAYGYYINQTDQLLKKGVISDGKYEELLLSAFRDDLVFDTKKGNEIID